MNLYKISQWINDGPRAFDGAVVVAPDPEIARLMTPWPPQLSEVYGAECWVDPMDVQVQCIGVAAPDVPRGVVLASFNEA